MMNAINALLEARDPALGRFRAYRLVQVTYGRIGTTSRWLRYIIGDQAEARTLICHCIRRRATARRQIGVSYCFRELTDPWRWLPLTADLGVIR